MKLDSLDRPTTKLCGCGRELGRTVSQCPCGYLFNLEVIATPEPDIDDHRLLLSKLRVIGRPEVLKWEALAERYALAHYRQDHAG